MNFSEANLVDLFLDEGGTIIPQWWPDTYSTVRKKYKYDFNFKKEVVLPSGRRCDLVGYHKTGRITCVIEFKIVADFHTLLQVIEYRKELRSQRKSRFSFHVACIAAQFFKDGIVDMASELGIGAVHIAPVNYKTCNISHLNDPCLRTQHGQSKNIITFKRFGGGHYV